MKPNEGALDMDEEIVLHPLFEDMDCVFVEEKMSEVKRYKGSSYDYDSLNAYHCAACGEFAIYPPCTFMQLDLLDGGLCNVRARAEGGITNCVLFQTIGKYSGSDAYRSLGDRRGWTGWEAYGYLKDGKGLWCDASTYDS
ncbi:hypothetical protein JCM8547_007517 [Rhodosporidiobolus lusitaniae]